MPDKIYVLDFGSQYNQLIARRIREFGVYSELLPNYTPLEKILSSKDVKGIVLSGGPNSVYDPASLKLDPKILESGIPVLGICYGMQLIHHMLGGKVESADSREYGRADITVHDDCSLFEDTPRTQTVWMSHGDQVTKLAEGFTCLASSDTCANAASYDPMRRIYTVQFHPEVRHSVYGNDILKNFVFHICKASANWSMDDFIEEKVREVRETVKDDKVLLALSGGVDSSVVAALLSKAVGKNLYCMFIDHGLLRKNESEEVMNIFRDKELNLVRIDASKRFMGDLKGVTDPEEKRKIIGRDFIYTFRDEVIKLTEGEGIKWLAQGTLYTDKIESGTNTAQTIKSHHNVGGLPKDLNFKLIEPLDTLFKDEVRELGRKLGLPDFLVDRQPFPGPGLAVRCLGEITEEKLEIIRNADYIVREEIAKAGLQKDIWQYFAALLNDRTVGVMGDQRTYDYIVAVRAVTSIDGMTGDWAKIPYEVLDVIANRIVNEVNHVNRVVYDITSKPPGTIEFE